MATTRQILEQPQSPFIQRIKSSGNIGMNGSPMIDDKEEELSQSAFALFKAKEDEIERRKMEVKDRVQTKLGLAEEATRRLAEIREVSLVCNIFKNLMIKDFHFERVCGLYISRNWKLLLIQ